MSFEFNRCIIKDKLNIYPFLLFLLILGQVLGTDVDVGTSVVKNECSTLGSNNPLRLLDCSVFKLKKGMCCLLTITLTETIEQDGVQSIQESYKTACIILEKMDAQTRKAATNEYKKLGGDVLIECCEYYLHVLYIYLFLFVCLLFI